MPTYFLANGQVCPLRGRPHLEHICTHDLRAGFARAGAGAAGVGAAGVGAAGVGAAMKAGAATAWPSLPVRARGDALDAV